VLIEFVPTFSNVRTSSIGAALELEFAAVCARKGAIVCAPLGGQAVSFDLVLFVGKNNFRVQVKSATLCRNGYYVINTQARIPTVGKNNLVSTRPAPYAEGAVDVLVTKVGEDWYLFKDVHLLPATIAIGIGKMNKKYGHGANAWKHIALEVS
jgi:hypothetical protein